MKPARMKKIKAVVLDEKMDSVVRALHEDGHVELCEYISKAENSELSELLSPSTPAPYGRPVASLLIKVSRILDLFDSVKEEEKKGISEILNPQLPNKKKISFNHSDELLNYVENTLSNIEKNVNQLSNKLNELESKKSSLESLTASLKNISQFDVDLSLIGIGEYVYVTVGLISENNLSNLKSNLSAVTGEYFEIIQGNSVTLEGGDIKIPVIIVSLSQQLDEVNAELRKSGFERIDIPKLEGTPNEIISKTSSEISNINSEIKNTINEINKISKEWYDKLLVAHEVLEIERERAEAYAYCGKTDRTYVIDGWVPEKYYNKVKEIIENASEGYAVVESEKVNAPEEEIPVLLDNPKWAKPFEMLTNMFAPPKYNEIDPTMLIIPGFLMFYGIMLTDAVYGFLLMLSGLFMWKKLGKVSEGAHDLGYILTLSGIFTMIAGIITGGYLGDFLLQFLNIDLYNTPFAILNPLGSSLYVGENNPLIDLGILSVNNGPIAILLFSVIVGIIHLFIALTIGFKENLSRNKIKEAILNQGIWIFLIIALIVGLAINMPMIIVGAVGVAILLSVIKGYLEGGPLNAGLGLLDITGFLGNVLSYARLLALCLATGGLAMAVNIMANLLKDSIPVVGIIFAIVMLIGGHAFNFVMNGLGSFIHSLRLHYVEFFGQFYEGGGKRFKPFKANREYTTE